MNPYPKPPPKVEKAPPQRIARKPIKRGKMKAKRTKRIRKSNAYMRPEWRALVRQVRKRSKGVCEARVKCDGDPVEGDPHHTDYLPFVGWQRLIVPLDWLVDCCHRCHKSFHDRP